MEFLVLHDVDLIISRVESNMHDEEIQEDEDEDMESPDMGNTFCDAPSLSTPPFLLSTHKVSEISMN